MMPANENNPGITIHGISKSYLDKGKVTPVLNKVTFEVWNGEFLVLFGPNGCGKTTLLNIIASLMPADEGEVRFRGKHRLNYVFQNYRESLLPWLTAKDNICLPLKLQGMNKRDQYNTFDRLLSTLGFDFHIDFKAYPYQLSGGQQQFTAILRGIITNPTLMLMDEPFSSLDYRTTLELENAVLQIWKQFNITLLFVTHDIDEAVYLGDRIILFSDAPSHVAEVVDNPLPRPRTLNMRGTSHFSEIKGRVLQVFMQASRNHIINNYNYE